MSDAMPHPDPNDRFPIPWLRNTVFLKPLLTAHPEFTNISVGEFSYYSEFGDPESFFEKNVRYNFGFSGARLEIGKFCALAHGTTFVMADANHVIDGISTYPFPIFGKSWADAMPMAEMPFPNKGDIVVGNDVWFGMDSLTMPGVRVGHGAIVAARAVVTRDVPDYAVVAGNPARVVRMRFAEPVVERLLALSWWDWPLDRLQKAIPHLVKGDVDQLEKL